MDKAVIGTLIQLIDKKILLMDDYDSITLRLTLEDMDKLENLVKARQDIIEQVDIIDKDISVIISGQSESRQQILKKLFSMNALDEEYSQNMTVIKNKLIKLKEVLKSIKTKEEKVSRRLLEYKSQLSEELLKLSKGKQIIDYMDSASKSELFNGSKFDMNS